MGSPLVQGGGERDRAVIRFDAGRRRGGEAGGDEGVPGEARENRLRDLGDPGDCSFGGVLGRPPMPGDVGGELLF